MYWLNCVPLQKWMICWGSKTWLVPKSVNLFINRILVEVIELKWDHGSRFQSSTPGIYIKGEIWGLRDDSVGKYLLCQYEDLSLTPEWQSDLGFLNILMSDLQPSARETDTLFKTIHFWTLLWQPQETTTISVLWTRALRYRDSEPLMPAYTVTSQRGFDLQYW